MTGQLADQEKVAYTVAVDQDETRQKRLTCNITVGDREIVNVGDGLTRIEIETRAADEACKTLRMEGRRLGKGRNGIAGGKVDREVCIFLRQRVLPYLVAQWVDFWSLGATP